jgi:hypothetical protein
VELEIINSLLCSRASAGFSDVAGNPFSTIDAKRKKRFIAKSQRRQDAKKKMRTSLSPLPALPLASLRLRVFALRFFASHEFRFFPINADERGFVFPTLQTLRTWRDDP